MKKNQAIKSWKEIENADIATLTATMGRITTAAGLHTPKERISYVMERLPPHSLQTLAEVAETLLVCVLRDRIRSYSRTQ